MKNIQYISCLELFELISSHNDFCLLDVRTKSEFNEKHILGSSSIPRSDIEFQLPRLIPFKNTKIILNDSDSKRSFYTVPQLIDIGYSNVLVLDGGLNKWIAEGYSYTEGMNVPSKSFGEQVLHADDPPEVTPEELFKKMENGEKLLLIDTRTPEEYSRATMPNSINIPNGELINRVPELDEEFDGQIVIHCGGRTRSIIGASLMHALGYTDIISLKDGTMGWLLAGYELQYNNQVEDFIDTTSNFKKIAQELAKNMRSQNEIKTIDQSELKKIISANVESNIYYIDVRTVSEYKKSHLSMFDWMAGGQLIQRTDETIGVKNARIILLCNDMTRSTVGAYWLKRMGYNNVQVVSGGLEKCFDIDFQFTSGFPDPLLNLLTDYKSISSSGLLESIRNNENQTILYLGNSVDYTNGHIANSYWLPKDWLEIYIGTVIPNKEEKIILVCNDGLRSTLATKILRELGYGNVIVLANGLDDWNSNKLPLTIDSNNEYDYPNDVFVHPLGNRELMLKYLTWEKALVQEDAV
jgi:rhodanese-related sulfurtransferase